MISGSLRPVLISTFAVLFGLAQIFCGCISAQASTANYAGSQAPLELQSQFGFSHNIMNQLDMSEDHSGSDHNNDGHDHNDQHAEDCTHCDGYVGVTQASDSNPSAAIPSPSIEKAALPNLIQPPQARANIAPSALAGLRWLHPPNETPITLKIRLQN